VVFRIMWNRVDDDDVGDNEDRMMSVIGCMTLINMVTRLQPTIQRCDYTDNQA